MIRHYTGIEMMAMITHELQRQALIAEGSTYLAPWWGLREDHREVAIDEAAQWIELLTHIEQFVQDLENRGLTAAAKYGREHLGNLTHQALTGGAFL